MQERKHTDRQTDRQTDKQTDRQTDATDQHTCQKKKKFFFCQVTNRKTLNGTEQDRCRNFISASNKRLDKQTDQHTSEKIFFFASNKQTDKQTEKLLTEPSKRDAEMNFGI